MSRQILKPTDEKLVRSLAKIHCTNYEIADIIGVDESTIRKAYSAILIKARQEGKQKLRRLQWKAAESGNIVMLIWLGKQILGQADSMNIDSKITNIKTTSFSTMSTEALKKIRDIVVEDKPDKADNDKPE